MGGTHPTREYRAKLILVEVYSADYRLVARPQSKQSPDST